MKTYIYVMSITTLLIYIGSVVLNQQDYAWTDWSAVVGGVWNFALVFGVFHFYRKSKYKIWFIDIVFLSLIGFTAIDITHSIFCLCVWLFSNRGINEILIDSFDHYNPFNCLLAILVTGTAGFLYLINLPDILNKR